MRVQWSTDPGFPPPGAWDEFVGNHPQGNLLQSWTWGEFKEYQGWRPLRLMISERGQTLAAAQMFLLPFPYRTLAYVPRGPLFEPADHELGHAVLQALHHRAHRHRAIALKVEPPWLGSAENIAWWVGEGFRKGVPNIQPTRTFVVDLLRDEEAILGGMKPKCRYNVHLALRRDIIIRQGSLDDVPTFYALLRETAARDGFDIHQLGYYEAAFRLLHPSGHMVLLLADYQGEPLAGLVAFAFGHQGIYMYGASADRERHRMPNHLLQWQAMRWAKARGCSTYDLWGNIEPRASSTGGFQASLASFKASFGGREIRYVGALDYVYSPLLHRAFNWVWDRKRAADRPSAVKRKET